MSKFLCLPCGYVYDEAKNNDGNDIKFDDLPCNWRCPECSSTKYDFEEIKDKIDEKV